jgi:glucuronokinase
MDLDQRLIESRGFGEYERLDPTILPAFYLAYKTDLGKVSGTVHNELRRAYDSGDPKAVWAVREMAALAEEGRKSYGRRDFSAWPSLMDRNFDLRRKVMTISPGNLEMVETARRCGASANFAGSGGSIVGIYQDLDMYEQLVRELGRLGAQVLKPKIV